VPFDMYNWYMTCQTRSHEINLIDMSWNTVN
jgi:hypothetical protein